MISAGCRPAGQRCTRPVLFRSWSWMPSAWRILYRKKLRCVLFYVFHKIHSFPVCVICGCSVYKKSPFHTDNLSVQKRRRSIFSVVPLFLTQLMRPLITSNNVYSGNGECPAQPTDTGQRPYVPPAAQGPVILNALLPAHTCRRLSETQSAFSYLPVKAFFFMIHQRRSPAL